MQRDMDLIRELLLKLEALPLPSGANMYLQPEDEEVAVPEHSADQIAYHLDLIQNAGFLEQSRSNPARGIMFCGLSWAGHDFLDSVRNPETWAKTKKGALAAGGWTADILKDLAKGFIKKQIEEYTGVKL
ncbi:DUF2513 domain-containing protein [Siculibacillus lacustris]|uniref:DUF2513 domain-containing protein n=1 Tax=Siculibacillus lacustris TaxID=1549641 RepID=A0A4Q9VDR1_9HYPH|nr:DUF2513 domain-containing protein [Siculibacillus lacustris]TBW32844.1 DUF2513 domain-containing protein [Siculibacillus lacustris]